MKLCKDLYLKGKREFFKLPSKLLKCLPSYFLNLDVNSTKRRSLGILTGFRELLTPVYLVHHSHSHK